MLNRLDRFAGQTDWRRYFFNAPRLLLQLARSVTQSTAKRDKESAFILLLFPYALFLLTSWRMFFFTGSGERDSYVRIVMSDTQKNKVSLCKRLSDCFRISIWNIFNVDTNLLFLGPRTYTHVPVRSAKMR